jgi:lipoprotein-anchoring transpeptidase ErfK/SrfK
MTTVPFLREIRLWVSAWLVLLAMGGVICGAMAQQTALFAAPKKQQKRASELIRKQEPPKVSPRVLEKAAPDSVSIYISLTKQRVYFRVYHEVAVDSPISSGKQAGMTPPGNYKVIEKDANHRSNIYGDFVNPRTGRVVRAGISTKIDSAPSGTVYRGAPMRWFMRLTESGLGMHTGILPGYPASHGCVRLPEEIAKLLYDRVQIGTPVTIGD